MPKITVWQGPSGDEQNHPRERVIRPKDAASDAELEAEPSETGMPSSGSTTTGEKNNESGQPFLPSLAPTTENPSAPDLTGNSTVPSQATTSTPVTASSSQKRQPGKASK